MQRPSLVLRFLSAAVAAAQAATQTVTALAAAPSSAIFGQAVALTASVSPPGATGKITFYVGTAILGTPGIAASLSEAEDRAPVPATVGNRSAFRACVAGMSCRMLPARRTIG